jgi:hypothetical protein
MRKRYVQVNMVISSGTQGPQLVIVLRPCTIRSRSSGSASSIRFLKDLVKSFMPGIRILRATRQAINGSSQT